MLLSREQDRLALLLSVHGNTHYECLLQVGGSQGHTDTGEAEGEAEAEAEAEG